MSEQYEVGKNGSYTASGFSPKDGVWDEEGYSRALKGALKKIGRSALKEVSWVAQQLDRPAEWLMRDFAGHGARTLDDLNIWHPVWDDPQSREFAWHNVPAMGYAAAMPWSVAKAAYRYPELLPPTGSKMVGFGMGPFIMKVSEIYNEVAPTFGQKHPDVTDALIKAFGADPLLMLGPIASGVKAPFIARDIATISALVKEARATKQGVLALANLQGKPLTPALLKAVMGKGSVEQTARALYSHGLRPVAPGQDFMEGVRLPYFRKAGTLFPPEMRDLAMQWPHIKEAAWAEHKAALEAIKKAVRDINPEDVESITRILDAIPRPEYMTAKQHGALIRSQMSQAVISGQLPEVMLGRAPSARAIDAAGIYAEMTKLGHAKGAPYMVNYSPGQKIPSGAWDGLVRKATGHHKPRTQGFKVYDDFRDLQKWALRVFMREGKKANTIEAGTAMLNRAQEAMTGLKAPKIENAEVLKGFAKEVEARIRTLRGLKGAAEKAGEANQIERFENAITETQALADAIMDIGVKNPKVLEDNNAMLELLHQGLSYIRMGQTLANPGWYTGNMLEGSARVALTTGEVVLDPMGSFVRGHAPVRGINLELMDFTHGNIRHQSKAALAGVAEDLGKVSDRIEKYNQQLLGGITYEKRVAYYRAEGMADDVVHAMAKSDALAEVKRIFPDYGDSSQFVNDLAPYFNYLKFNVYYNTEPILKWAAANPTEAVFANNMLELQYNTLTSDRYGKVRIPGTDFAVDPVDSTGARRIARLLANPQAVISEGDTTAAKLMKLAQVGTGQVVPPLHLVQKQLGLISELSPDVHIPAAEMVGDLTRHFTGSNPKMLTRAALEGGAFKTGELRDDPEFFRDMEIKRYMAGEELMGRPVTPEQAATFRDREEAVNGGIGFLTGIRPVLRTEGMEQLDTLKRYYDEDLEKRPDTARAREKMLEDIPALRGVVAIYQSSDDKIRNAVERIKQAQGSVEDIPLIKEATEFERAKILKAAPEGVYETLLDLWGKGVKKVDEVIKDVKDNVSVIDNAQTNFGSAQAAEMPSPVLPEPASGDPPPLVRAKGGKFIVAANQTMTKDDYLLAAGGSLEEQARYIQGLDTDRDTKLALQHINSAPSNEEALKRLAQHDQGARRVTNYILDPENRKSEVIGRMANVIEDPDTPNGTMATIGARKLVASALRDAALDMGISVKTMPVEKVRELFAAGKLNNAGTTLEAWGASSIKAGQLLINPNAVSYARQQKTEQDYEDFGKVIGALEAGTRNPATMDAVLDEVREMVDRGKAGLSGPGTLPADFAQRLDDIPKYRDLSERIGVAASYEQADMVLAGVLHRDPKTQSIYGINETALYSIAFNPKYEAIRPFVSAARAGYYGRPAQAAINRGIANLPAKDQEIMALAFPLDPQAIQARFEEDGKLRMGAELGVHELVKGLSAFALGAGSPLDGLTMPNLGQPPKPPPEKLGPPSITPGGAIERNFPGTTTYQGARAAAAGVLAGDGMLRVLPPVPPLMTAGGGVERGIAASRAASISQEMGGVLSGPPVSGDPRAFFEGPTAQNHAPFRSVSQLIGTSINEWQADKRAWEAKGMPGGDVPGGALSHIMGNAKLQIKNGTTAENIGVGVNAVSAGLSLAGTFDLLPTEGDGAAAINGFMVGASTFMMLGGPATAPISAPIAIAAGIYTGLKGAKKQSGGGFNAEANRINQERLNLERERFAESLKQQSIRDLRTRESDLAKAIGSFTPQQRQQVGEQLAKFQRRPTYQSRIGLVDAAERAVGSAIKPRY